ncbi:hypothetical protein ACJMK2_014055 [Sinanodonta woodiana]|uniref:DUF4371 domain-containing protein n=1 Tax=Sinanodonta woodiana TaxID=1069815 RepID=A0ABD3UZE5_SINWO
MERNSQNLALRGHVETLDSDSPGNFLATLKLRNVRENPGSVSYLSHDIQNEILSLFANAVRDKIINAIKEAMYFGILFDSNPDIYHTEQLTEVTRYVHFDFETGNATVKETFIKFVELDKKNATGYEEIILRSLEEDNLNFLYCRAQLYDNAAVMSGSITGYKQDCVRKNKKQSSIHQLCQTRT